MIDTCAIHRSFQATSLNPFPVAQAETLRKSELAWGNALCRDDACWTSLSCGQFLVGGVWVVYVWLVYIFSLPFCRVKLIFLVHPPSHEPLE